MCKSSRNKAIILAFFLIIVALVIFFLPNIEQEYVYKIEYSEIVDKFSEETGLDKYFIYAVIKTESDFDEKATSNVGARGLMQIMPDAFDWVKYKKNDTREITFDNMYDAEYNIEYGGYLLLYLKDKYNSEKLAIAAYHGGATAVDKWLQDKSISKDGVTIDEFPSDATNHYVNKVLKAWESYKNLYENE